MFNILFCVLFVFGLPPQWYYYASKKACFREIFLKWWPYFHSWLDAKKKSNFLSRLKLDSKKLTRSIAYLLTLIFRRVTGSTGNGAYAWSCKQALSNNKWPDMSLIGITCIPSRWAELHLQIEIGRAGISRTWAFRIIFRAKKNGLRLFS